MASAALKTVNYKFKWIIKNVTRESIVKHDKNDSLKTENIQTRLDNCLIECFLKLYYDVGENSVSLFFYKTKPRNSNSYMLSFCAEMQNFQVKFEKPLCEVDSNWGWSNFIELDKLFDPGHKYIDDEKCLKLAVEIKFTEMLKANDNLSVSSLLVPDLYSQFYNAKTLSDLTFKCSDDVELPVHQVVLAANSPVFLKMFTTEMKEKKANAVIFEDISSDTMNTVLEYVYTKDFCFSDVKSTIKILYVAEKYEFSDLKRICVDELLVKVAKENALEIFEIADLYNVHMLEKKCLSIITENYEDIKSTEKYDELEKPLTRKITDEFARLLGLVQNFEIESSM